MYVLLPVSIHSPHIDTLPRTIGYRRLVLVRLPVGRSIHAPRHDARVSRDTLRRGHNGPYTHLAVCCEQVGGGGREEVQYISYITSQHTTLCSVVSYITSLSTTPPQTVTVRAVGSSGR